MFSQVQSALDSLTAALGSVDAAPTEALREALALAKPLRVRLETLETAVASQIAAREKHGDGGVGVLHQVAAVPRSDAARNVRTAAELEQLPDAQSALAGGEMCMANAARLARAARQTSPKAVQGDPVLVDLAKTLPPDEFAHASARWTAKHQSAASLAERHRRNRRNRNVRFWNGDDGSVQMRGAFDAEMGARIQDRIRAEAERLRQADRRLLRNGPEHNSTACNDTALNGTAGQSAMRTRDQRMADALDGLLAHTRPAPAHGDAAGGHSTSGSTPAGGAAPIAARHEDTAASCGHATCDGTGPAGRTAPPVQMIVRADLADLLDSRSGIGGIDGLGGMGEIAGTGPVPASVVDRLACNADISVVLFGKQITPLYEAVASRAPTAAQRRALIARDGACIGCGAPPGDCEAHHIIPWLCGGPTKIDNLVLVCWSCHDKIHDHNWQVIKRDNRYRLIPPDAASLPNPARSRKPTKRHNPTPSPKTTPPRQTVTPTKPAPHREPALFP
ncbi:HNH endonuclease [Candidatus Poriferisodalis sp.]|uniref:HNH endonuclease signature motif containing protein n=1 Tax=Candidatus Poriferisodalis sp. TaxID=3101277 RepID=UPI003B5CF20C